MHKIARGAPARRDETASAHQAFERIVEDWSRTAEGHAREAVRLEAERREFDRINPAEAVHHAGRVAEHRGAGRAEQACRVDQVDLVEVGVGVVKLGDCQVLPPA